MAENIVGHARNFRDLTGQRFSRLVVLRLARIENKRTVWLCQCDCGNTKEIVGSSLVRKKATTSCGCRATELKFKHGKPPEYFVWQGMKARCNNPKHRYFANYGGRGIKVCARWESFEAFYQDMGQRPSDKHQIERKANDHQTNIRLNERTTTIRQTSD